MKFKVGDRVKTKDGLGTVKAIDFSNNTYAVDFDRDIGGWEKEEFGIRRGHGLYVGEHALELVKEEDTKIVMCKFNNTMNGFYYWLITPNMGYEIGDYAIVENKNDYDLVKIICTIETNKKYEKFFTNGNPLKKVVNVIKRNEIRKD